jgi:hypothetical protein
MNRIVSATLALVLGVVFTAPAMGREDIVSGSSGHASFDFALGFAF